MEIFRKEGNRNVNRELEFYNLDAIIAPGYRVNSKKTTKFRIWATKILKDITIEKDELTEVRWFSMEKLEHMVKTKELNENQIACFIKASNFLKNIKC